jgi:hypothetical protein
VRPLKVTASSALPPTNHRAQKIATQHDRPLHPLRLKLIGASLAGFSPPKQPSSLASLAAHGGQPRTCPCGPAGRENRWRSLKTFALVGRPARRHDD